MVAPALAIVNPVAARGSGAALWRRLEPAARALLPGLTVRLTEGPGNAEEIAREWALRPRAGPLLVAGGDGTAHEAVNGLLGLGVTPPLAIIPAGTGNDFARNTGIPLNAEEALARIGGGALRRVDVVRLEFREPGGASRTVFALNSVSVGVGPRANLIAHRIRGAIPGHLCYPLAGVAALISNRMGRYTVTADGRAIHQGAALNITVANCATFGGGMRISPGSRPDDGVLEQVVIGRLGLFRALLALSRLYGGTHVGMRGVTVTPLTGSVRIARSDGPLLIEADGQSFTAVGELAVEVLPDGLGLLN